MLPYPLSFRDYLPQISFQVSRQAEDPAPAGGYFYLISLYLCRTSPTRGKSDTRKVLNLAGLSIFLGNLSIETK
jgi:hypothetical protein